MKDTAKSPIKLAENTKEGEDRKPKKSNTSRKLNMQQGEVDPENALNEIV